MVAVVVVVVVDIRCSTLHSALLGWWLDWHRCTGALCHLLNPCRVPVGAVGEYRWLSTTAADMSVFGKVRGSGGVSAVDGWWTDQDDPLKGCWYRWVLVKGPPKGARAIKVDEGG